MLLGIIPRNRTKFRKTVYPTACVSVRTTVWGVGELVIICISISDRNTSVWLSWSPPSPPSPHHPHHHHHHYCFHHTSRPSHLLLRCSQSSFGWSTSRNFVHSAGKTKERGLRWDQAIHAKTLDCFPPCESVNQSIVTCRCRRGDFLHRSAVNIRVKIFGSPDFVIVFAIFEFTFAELHVRLSDLFPVFSQVSLITERPQHPIRQVFHPNRSSNSI